ncbi:MAG: GGDEF domain-containing protein [Planctomycetota bacterium]
MSKRRARVGSTSATSEAGNRTGSRTEIWRFLDGLRADLEPTDGPLDPDTPRRVALSGLGRFASFVRARHGSLYLGEPASGFHLLGELSGRKLPTDVPGSAGGLDAPETPTLMQFAARRRQPLLVSDVTEFRREHRVAPPPSTAPDLGPACVVVPLSCQDRAVGVINLSGLDIPPPTASSLEGEALSHAARIMGTSLRLMAYLGRLEGMASRDGLTGLLNYATFYDALAREVLRAQRYETPLSLILIDLDHFKGINDRYGHLAGDKILTDLSDRIRQALRAADLAARYGGDEFAVILPQTNREGAVRVAERIRANILAVPFEYLQTRLPVTVSLGVGELEPGMTAVDIVGKTDKGLYKAKNAGRDQVGF